MQQRILIDTSQNDNINRSIFPGRYIWSASIAGNSRFRQPAIILFRPAFIFRYLPERKKEIIIKI
jgi:hypothetical protein